MILHPSILLYLYIIEKLHNYSTILPDYMYLYSLELVSIMQDDRLVYPFSHGNLLIELPEKSHIKIDGLLKIIIIQFV